MGDSACVMHAFSYTSPISSEVQQGNPIHALGDSISFGRFMSESLAWERWSTFSHKRYVEEAASYAQPGSVAQKKAFFDAHYKKIAAKKATAPALEQPNSTNSTNDEDGSISSPSKITTINTPVAIQQDKTSNSEHDSIAQQAKPETYDSDKTNLVTETEASLETPMSNEEPFSKKSNSFNQEESSATSKKRPSFSSMLSSPKSLRTSIDSPSTDEPGKLQEPLMPKTDSSRLSPTSDKASKDCSMTPPSSEKIRTKMSVDTPVSGSKFPSAVSKSPNAYREPEDKFKAKEAEKVKLHTKLKRKAKMELRKLRQSLCFRAQTLPDSYKQKDDSKKNASASKL